MRVVITVLEAKVDKEKQELLEQVYSKETANVPESIKQTLLIQSQNDPQKWQIITHWRSQLDLDKMRATEKIPLAVRIFSSVDSAPSLEIWNSKAHRIGPNFNI